MSGVEGAEREDFDDGEAGVGIRGQGPGIRGSNELEVRSCFCDCAEGTNRWPRGLTRGVVSVK
jgi:hypothetical protein